MPSSVEAYLSDLRQALAGRDVALVQDALWEARARMDAELKRLAWEAPALSEGEALERVFQGMGSPEEAASRYLQRDQLVREALGPGPLPDLGTQGGAPRPWPTFFGILQDSKAYTSAIYLLLSLITGIFYWTWVWFGLGLSLGLSMILIGIPLLVFALGSFRALALGEGRLVEALLDVRMPRRPRFLPEGGTWWQRLRNLFTDGYTWRSLVYLLLQLPLSIAYFTVMVVLSSISLGLAVFPLFRWTGLSSEVMIVGLGRPITAAELPPHLALLLVFLGFLGLVLTLHAALGLGRLHGLVARGLLVGR
jgi:hypothetical protein